MLGHQAAMRFLKTEDADERSLLQALAAGARQIQSEHDHERAIQIANQVGKMLGGHG